MQSLPQLMASVDIHLTNILDTTRDRTLFNDLIQNVKNDFITSLDNETQIYWKKYLNIKKEFMTERDMLVSYKKKVEQGDKQVMKHDIKRVIENVEEKQKFQFKYKYPINRKEIGLQEIQKEKMVLEAELQALKDLLLDVSIKDRKVLIQKLGQSSGYYKQRLKEIKDYKQNNDKNLNLISTTLPHLQVELLLRPRLLTMNFPHWVSTIQFSKIQIQQWRHFSNILSSMTSLSSITLYFMDNQFDQNKCDIIKSMLKDKKLQKLKINNYYIQCKMGVFVDFNWAPWRKLIHIFAGKW